MTLFTGLSAFPLTPLMHDDLDEGSFIGLIQRLTAAGVDSITALGSTGSYPYLTCAERARAARLAVEHAGQVPVFVGVGALRTSEVLKNVDAAEEAGASAALLAPMSYQPLTEGDVFELFRTVAERSSLPVIVYDNPGTTGFHFTTELYGRIAQLDRVASIKIPAVPGDPAEARAHVAAIREAIPDDVTLGVSGDPSAAAGLNAGCQSWYSVIGGTLPQPALVIARAALAGCPEVAEAESQRLAPLWDLFTEFGGSLRVVAAIAEHLGLAPQRSLPLPIQGLDPAQRQHVAAVLNELRLA